MAILPVVLVTSVVTGLWWFVGIGAGTDVLRDHYTSAQRMPPMTLSAGSAQSHIAVSLGLASPAGRVAFGTVVGVVFLLTLPLATRACTAAQAGLGQLLLSDASALHRRISGLEQERDTARAQTVAAVTAEAAALRRLERDIHDGPQQRLVRLAMELGRAEHHLDSRPEAAREALADAIVQAREALDELRALSRGIAPPVLADRGLREALTALAALSAIPVELDADLLGGRLDPAVETAAYFVVAEALTNVAKHSHARHGTVGLRHGAGTLRVWVADDGAGGAALDKGHGLRGLDDRLGGQRPAAGGQSRRRPDDGHGRAAVLLTPGDPAEPQGHPARGPLRIVVADDSVLLREGLVRLLAEDGHEVLAAVGDGPLWSRRCARTTRMSASSTCGCRRATPMRACARRSPPARTCPAPPCWCSVSTWRRPTRATCSRTAPAGSATC